jgi:muramoyltetrapeptide carboxypeptidase
MNRKSFLKSVVSTGVGSLILNKGFASPTNEIGSAAPVIIPPYLKAGDTIGITCPAGAVDLATMECCCYALEKWGLNVKLGKTVGKRWQRFAGTDQERLEDFQELLDDETVKAIIFGKGGYGTMRIIDKINWDKFKKQPKWLVGYSDLTVVHLHVHSNLNICTIHGNMSNGFSDDPYDAAALSLYQVLFGDKTEYSLKSFEMNRTGSASGILVGGNLTLVNACTASKSDINTNGKILLIEDVREFKYNIDRMMMSLKRSGKLDKLAGLVVGEFTASRNDEEDTFDMRIEDIIYDKVKEYDYPVCFHFPAGHIADNRALKIGMNYELRVGREMATLEETVMETPSGSVVTGSNISVN